VITVQPNIPPSLQFVRVTPGSGPVPSGSTFAVDVNALGNSNLFHITATVSGAVTGSFVTDGTRLRVQGTVPATALAGQQVQITAQAVDGLGQSTGPQVLTLPVSDGTPPTVAILSPLENALLTPGQPVPISVLVSDNSSNVMLGLSITGVVSTTQSVAVALTPNTPATNIFTVVLPPAPTNGGPLMAIVTATDAANNVGTVIQVFWLPGTQTTVVWERQALGQTLVCTNGSGSYSWPNNNNWSQSAQFGNPCNSGLLVETAPSNWSTTNFPNATNLDVILGSQGGAPANLDVSVALHSLTIQSDGGLNMADGTSLTAVDFDFQGDGGITRNGSPKGLVLDGGTMTKSGGTNAFTIDPGIPLGSSNGIFEVDSGTLALPGNGSSYANDFFDIQSAATLALVPVGHSATFSGSLTGLGAGQVQFSQGVLNGAGLLLNLPDQLFQWTGGTLAGTVTNSGAVNVAGTNSPSLGIGPAGGSGGTFYNAGLVRQGHDVSLGLGWNGTSFQNLRGGVYELAGDGNNVADNNLGGSLSPFFINYGLIRKSSGIGISQIGSAPGFVQLAFSNAGGTIEVDSGVLVLSGRGTSSNGIFNVSSGALLDLTGGASPTWAGQMTGSGAGQVRLGSGILSGVGLTLNLPSSLFQWTGGTLAGSVTNSGVVTISGSNSPALGVGPAGGSGGTFYNAGLVRQTNGVTLGLGWNGTSFQNLPNGVYELAGDGNNLADNNAGGSLKPFFNNFGLVRKSSGTGTAVIGTLPGFVNLLFENQGGVIEVDSGTLVLNGGGVSSNGTWNVSTGAVLDLTGGNSPAWAGVVTGSGLGQVRLNNGVLTGSGLTINLPGSLFQWTGGTLAGTVTNVGVVTISGTNSPSLGVGPVGGGGATFYNAGLVRQPDASTFGLGWDGTTFQNLPGGVYDLAGDNNHVANNNAGGGTPPVFINSGLVRKSSGTGVSVIGTAPGLPPLAFRNQGGAIEVDSGVLSLGPNSFVAGTGALTVLLGGTNSGQFGQLSAGSAALSGTLNVGLTNGFVPAPGEQFPILTSGGISGGFSRVSMPSGFVLRYTNGNAVLVFTGQSNRPPVLQFAQVAPTNGPLPSGAPFEVDVAASDDDGIAQITASITGAVTNSFTTNGSLLRIVGVVPPAALAGAEVQITAQAIDLIGQSTGPQVLTLPVSDGTPPAVAILDPPLNTLLPLGQPLKLSTVVSDNSTNVTLNLSIFGSLTATQTVAVPLPPNVPVTNLFTVPVGGNSPGGQFTATVTATDAATNVTTVSRNFFLPPSQPIPISWQQWSGSNFPSSGAFQVTLGGGTFSLNTAVTLDTLIIQPDGTLNMLSPGPGSSITAEHFIFQGDGVITRSGCCGPTTLNLDGGTMEKTGGTNTFSIDPGIVFNSLDGTFIVDSGTLALPGNNSSYLDGVFQVASNAALNLVPANNTANFAGTFTGSGSGTVLLDAGTLSAGAGGATFDLPPPLFQWTGGTLQGSNPLTNAGAIQLAGTNGVTLAGTLSNAGLLEHNGAANLNLSSPGPGASFENLAGGTYALDSDAGIISAGCCGPTVFDNYGLFRKNAGTGDSLINVAFNNLGGTVDVQSGTLTLANNGRSFGGTWTVASGATLDPTGGANPSWSGRMTGTGAGQVLLSQGTLSAAPSLELDFADHLFQWAGGTLVGLVTNLDVVSISGTNPSFLSLEFDNLGLVRHTGTGSLAVLELPRGHLPVRK
jgi:hypothetical protein